MEDNQYTRHSSRPPSSIPNCFITQYMLIVLFLPDINLSACFCENKSIKPYLLIHMATLAVHISKRVM